MKDGCEDAWKQGKSSIKSAEGIQIRVEKTFNTRSGNKLKAGLGGAEFTEMEYVI